MLIDDWRGAGRGELVVGCRWLVGCGLAMAAGCSAHPTDRKDPLEFLKTPPGPSAAALEEPRLFGATLTPPRAAGRRALEALDPGGTAQEWSDLAALPALGEVDARADRLRSAGTANETYAARLLGKENLIVPPDAWRRPTRYGGESDWQNVLGAELARASEVPPAKLRDVAAIEDASREALRRSADPLIFEAPGRLDDVFDSSSFLAAELSSAKAAGPEAAAAWLERRRGRLSTMQFAEGRVVFGFKGATNPAESAPDPRFSADLGSLGHLPAKVDVGIGLGRGTPGLAALSDTTGAVGNFAREQQQTFGLNSEPTTSALDPGASSRHGPASPVRVLIADQYGGTIKWWLAAGLSHDPAAGTSPVGDLAPEQPVGIDAGVQYELGPEVAVAAAYGYHDRTDVRVDTSRIPAAGERSDEQLHTASLRLIWRFATATEAAGPAAAE